LHEIRDLARSTLEKAKKDDFNTTSAEFWMGHTIDPLGYNKLWQVEPEYNLAQYNIAVRYLNILSGPVTTIAEDPEQLLERLKTSPAFHKYVESMMADNPVLASTIARAAFKDSETVREIFSRFVEEGLTITAEGLTIRAKQPKRTRSNA
jgi:hypothetical protein